MADDERLREALLELQFLRDREAQSLAQTKILAECLEAYSSASDPEEALQGLFSALKSRICADLSLVVERHDNGRYAVADATERRLRGQVFAAPVNLLQRARHVSEASSLGAWEGLSCISNYAGLLICPVQTDMAVIGLRRAPHKFAKADMQLFQRLAGLAAQAYRNAAVAREKDLLSAAIAGSSSGIAIADASRSDLPLQYVNRAFEELSGYSAAEVLGENCRFLTAEPKQSPERVRLRKAVADRSSGTFLLRNRRKSGELFWNELSLFPVRDSTGRVHSMVATQTDVSERVAANEARDQARARMEQAFSATEDAFLVLEADGRVALSNDAFSDLFPAPDRNWRRKSTFRQNWDAYLAFAEALSGRVSSLLRAADLQALSRVSSGQELDLPDGRSALVRCAELEDGGLVVTATDISAMKSAQNLLSQRLAAIEAAPDGIAITDDDGRLIYLNSAGAKLFGFKRATSGLGRVWRHQYRNHVTLARMRPFEPMTAELDDNRGTIHELTSSPLEREGHIIIVRDVTEKLATEAREEDLMRGLTRLQRQEAIAQLTAGVAHDFNNYLAAINGSATLIDMAPDLPEHLRDHVQRIAAAGVQSAKLVNRLLDIGAGSGATSHFDLASELQDLPRLVEPMFAQGVAFTMHLPESPLLLRGDASDFNQVLINVLLNAGEAIDDDVGLVTLRAYAHCAGDRSDVTIGTLIAGMEYACLDVEDTGHGMDETTLHKVFEPYFSTKGPHGTGLGMAMVAAQIVSSGGAISLRSSPGAGTRVRLYWPIAPRDMDQVAETGDGALDLSGMTLLIVDDDEQVSDVMARYLEAHGAEVAQCSDPKDAVEAITEDPGAWSALISDYDMPGMSGGELAERARHCSPELPIVIVTALARRLRDPRLGDAKVAAILPKPVDLSRLTKTLFDAAQT